MEQAREGLAESDQAHFVHDLDEEARIEKVAVRVVDAADVLRDGTPVVGEPPIEGVSAHTIVDHARSHGAAHVTYATADQAIEEVVREARPGDIVLTLGAGDVWKLADALLARLLAAEMAAGRGAALAAGRAAEGSQP